MQTRTDPRIPFRTLRHQWRGLLALALVAMLALQSFGLVHQLDGVHHPAEELCEFCSHGGHGNAPLATPPVLPAPVARLAQLPDFVPVITTAFRHFPPPARGPPAYFV